MMAWRTADRLGDGGGPGRRVVHFFPAPPDDARRGEGPAGIRPRNSAMPAPSRTIQKASSHGRTCTSSRSSETSIPTTIASLRSHPYASGLRETLPKRLFGFDGTADEDPRLPSGLVYLGNDDLPPPTASGILPKTAEFKQKWCLLRADTMF